MTKQKNQLSLALIVFLLGLSSTAMAEQLRINITTYTEKDSYTAIASECNDKRFKMLSPVIIAKGTPNEPKITPILFNWTRDSSSKVPLTCNFTINNAAGNKSAEISVKVSADGYHTSDFVGDHIKKIIRNSNHSYQIFPLT